MTNQSFHRQVLETESAGYEDSASLEVTHPGRKGGKVNVHGKPPLGQAPVTAQVSATIFDTAFPLTQLEQLKAENALLMKQVAEQALELRTAQAEALQAVELKSQFMANVSHELRTPMSGVLGMAELLKEMTLTEEQEELVNYIYISAAGLVDVINTLLDFSRLQAGKLRLERSEFSLGKMLGTVDEIFGEAARKKGIKFKTVIAHDVPDRVVGDEQRIRQVLSGLANNAVKFSAKGTIQVSVDLQRSFDNIAVLSFRVKDTGIGIEAGELDRVFLPFAQADGSNTRKYGGVGLGLPICTRLVKLMSGAITVKSKVGHGSTFSFSLPLEVKK